jgi:hypothetical protein
MRAIPRAIGKTNYVLSSYPVLALGEVEWNFEAQEACVSMPKYKWQNSQAYAEADSEPMLSGSKRTSGPARRIRRCR